MHFRHQSRNWSREHDLVIKCEVSDQGTNRRAIITNRPGEAHYPDGTYQEYVDRCESENRNKELTVDLCTDRLSDHRYMANLFRVMMHCLSANLLVVIRDIVGEPPVVEPDADDLEEMELMLMDAAAVGEALDAGEFKVVPWSAAVALALRKMGA